MENNAKFTPGMPVWVVARDEDGNAFNHKKTLAFIDSGFDMHVLMEG